MVCPWFTVSLLEGYPHRAETRKTRKRFQIVEAHFGPLLSRYHEVTAFPKTFNRTVVNHNKMCSEPARDKINAGESLGRTVTGMQDHSSVGSPVVPMGMTIAEA